MSIVQQALALAKKNDTQILLATTIASAAVTVLAAVKADRSVREKIDPDAKGVDAVKQYMQRGWADLVPVAGSACIFVVSVVGLHKAHVKRYNGVLAAYGLAEQAFERYRRVVEKDPERKAAVRKDLNEDLKTTVSAEEVVDAHETGNGGDLVYDSYSGRYFRSSVVALERAENEFNHMLIHHGWASLNELYGLFDIPGCDAGEEVGWTSDYLVDMNINAHLNDNGVPCVAVDFYNNPPRHRSRTI